MKIIFCIFLQTVIFQIFELNSIQPINFLFWKRKKNKGILFLFQYKITLILRRQKMFEMSAEICKIKKIGNKLRKESWKFIQFNQLKSTTTFFFFLKHVIFSVFWQNVVTSWITKKIFCWIWIFSFDVVKQWVIWCEPWIASIDCKMNFSFETLTTKSVRKQTWQTKNVQNSRQQSQWWQRIARERKKQPKNNWQKWVDFKKEKNAMMKGEN